MTNRRRFLKLLGVGTASAPLAAKEALDANIAGLAMRGDDQTPIAPASAPSAMLERHRDGLEQYTKAVSWFQANGNKLPDHIEKRFRRDASFVQALDPDIASKRSWSMNVKINEQRQRNYKNAIENLIESSERRAAYRAFEAATGFKWPW